MINALNAGNLDISRGSSGMSKNKGVTPAAGPQYKDNVQQSAAQGNQSSSSSFETNTKASPVQNTAAQQSPVQGAMQSPVQQTPLQSAAQTTQLPAAPAQYPADSGKKAY
jgi:hypothetical protein